MSQNVKNVEKKRKISKNRQNTAKIFERTTKISKNRQKCLKTTKNVEKPS